MRTAFIALVLLTGFYLMTGLVYDEGDFGVQLVVKPRPSLTFVFGGGEEGAWRRRHPEEPNPWWQTKEFMLVAQGDTEGNDPWWETAFDLGLPAAALGLPILGSALAFRHLQRKRNARGAVPGGGG